MEPPPFNPEKEVGVLGGQAILTKRFTKIKTNKNKNTGYTRSLKPCGLWYIILKVVFFFTYHF